MRGAHYDFLWLLGITVCLISRLEFGGEGWIWVALFWTIVVLRTNIVKLEIEKLKFSGKV